MIVMLFGGEGWKKFGRESLAVGCSREDYRYVISSVSFGVPSCRYTNSLADAALCRSKCSKQVGSEMELGRRDILHLNQTMN